jgi:membrane protein
VGTIAAGTTFFLLLAIFPALAALVSVYGLLADPATIQGHLESLRGFLPGEMLTLLEDQLKRLATTQSSSLSVGFISGLGIALWSANNGVKALFDALNVAYEEEEKRGFFKLNAVALAFTLGGIVFTGLLVNVVVGVPVVLHGCRWVLWAACSWRCCRPSSCSGWRPCSSRSSTASGRAAAGPSGAGSPRARSRRRWCG